MRRGRHDNWRSDNPETWTNHNPRHSHGRHRPDLHGFLNRSAPRHWRPNFSAPYRGRTPVWRMPHPGGQPMASFNNRTALPMPPMMRPPPRFSWPPNQQPENTHSPNEFPSLYTCDIDNNMSRINFSQSNNINELCDKGIDQSLHDTINTVKQKLIQRECRGNDGNLDSTQDIPVPPVNELSSVDISQNIKPSEKRRIEHSRITLKSCLKKPDKKESTDPRTRLMSPPSKNVFENKSQVMRLKILQQLFKMDKNSMRQMLSNPDLSSKYGFAFQSLIRETRNKFTHQVRSAAEKSLKLHETSADSLQGKQIVQDAFMGHLGTMLDTDASVELLNMDPQVIAELSKVLQDDLMNPQVQHMPPAHHYEMMSTHLGVYPVLQSGNNLEEPGNNFVYDNTNLFSNYGTWNELRPTKEEYIYDEKILPFNESKTTEVTPILPLKDDSAIYNNIPAYSTSIAIQPASIKKEIDYSAQVTCNNPSNLSDLNSLNCNMDSINSQLRNIVKREVESPTKNIWLDDHKENDANKHGNSPSKHDNKLHSGSHESLKKHYDDKLGRRSRTSSHRSHNKYDNRTHENSKNYNQHKDRSYNKNHSDSSDKTNEKFKKITEKSVHETEGYKSSNINYPNTKSKNSMDGVHLNISDISLNNEDSVHLNQEEKKSPTSTSDLLKLSVKDSSFGKKRKLTEVNHHEKTPKSAYKESTNHNNESIDQPKLRDSMPASSTFKTVSCQTSSPPSTKSQGSQYQRVGKVESSTQVYESLIHSRSKGVQYIRQNLREIATQTLRLEGIPGVRDIIPTTITNLIKDAETQTMEIESPSRPDKEEDTPKLEPHEVFLGIIQNSITSLSNQDSILEKMKKIDTCIEVLIQEKFKLYSMLDSCSSSSPSTAGDQNKMSKFGMKIVQKSNPTKSTPRMKHKPLERLKKKDDVHHQPNILHNKDDKSNVKWFIGKQMNSSENQKPCEKTQPDEKRVHKHGAELRSRQSSRTSAGKPALLAPKKPSATSTPVVTKDRTKKTSYIQRKKPPSKISNKSDKINVNSSEKNDFEKSANTTSVQNKYVDEVLVFENNDGGNGSDYYDSAGLQVSVDCNFVASEEIIENYEIENIAEFQEINTSLDLQNTFHTKTRKSSEKLKKNGKSSLKIINDKLNSRNLENNSLDISKTCKRIPPLKIRKISNSRLKPLSKTKSSPLSTLMSELNDSDESDVEFNSNNILKNSNELLGLAETYSEASPVQFKVVDENSLSKSIPLTDDSDMPDCYVLLNRLNVDKCDNQSEVNDDVLSILNSGHNDSVIEDGIISSMESVPFFSLQDIDSMDHSLDQMQFGHLCDPDVPSMIDNMEENDTMHIIDNWDSKLFENVTLPEDRDLFNDKTLIRDEEPINFTDHNDSIIAIECVGNNFLAASLDGNVYYYGGRGKLLQTLNVSNNYAVTCLCIKSSKIPSMVYTGSLDSQLRCFNFKTGEKLLCDLDVGGAIQCMYQEWDTLYIGTRTGFVLQFNIKTNSLIPDSAIKFSDTTILALQAIKEGPRKVLLSASRSQHVTVKCASTGLLLRSFDGPNSTVYSILFNSGKVFCGTSGSDVQIFDFSSGDLVGVHTGGNGAVCLKMYRGLLFTGCYDGMIYVFKSAENEKPIACIPGPGKMLLALAIVNNKIIAGCKDRSLAIWPLPQEVIREFKTDIV